MCEYLSLPPFFCRHNAKKNKTYEKPQLCGRHRFRFTAVPAMLCTEIAASKVSAVVCNGALLLLAVDTGSWVRMRLAPREHKVRGFLRSQGIGHSSHARMLMKQMRSYVCSVLCVRDSSEIKTTREQERCNFPASVQCDPVLLHYQEHMLSVKSMQAFVGEKSCGERSCERS